MTEKSSIFKDAIGRPPCDYCANHADMKIDMFKGLVTSKSLNVCNDCIEKSTRLGQDIANASRIRITSYETGQYSTGPASKLQVLVATLKPKKGFRTITSAIRITTGRNRGRLLICAACHEPISPEAPGFLRWVTDEDGKQHSIRLFHRECCTDPENKDGFHQWTKLDDIDSLDRSDFTVIAAEMLDQIEKKWRTLKDLAEEKKT